MDPYHNPQSPHVFHILLALSQGAQHGYAIIGQVAEQSNGRLQLATGTLYSALKRLLALGWIEETAQNDNRRRVYGLSDEGRKVLVAETRRHRLMLEAAESQGAEQPFQSWP